MFAAALLAVLLSVACGGDSAPAATGLKVTAGEATDTTSMQKWIGLPGGNVLLKVTSPYVVSGLVNGTNYSFSVNGRTDGGPGGPGATPASATPKLAGSTWTAGTAPGSNDLRSVAYGATTATTTASVSTYVTAGMGGAMYSSHM